MSIFDKNLLPDEKIVYRTKKHYILFFNPVIWTIAAFCFFLIPNNLVKIAGIAPTAIALFFWLNQWLNFISSEFAITNKRILMREGFFFRHTNDTRLTTISNISVDQSLLGQLLNYGTVFIHAFGGDRDPFTEVENPFEFQKQVQIQLDNVTSPPLRNGP